MTQWHRGDYLISTDPARVDLAVVHGFLRESYWAKDIPLELVRRSIANSLNFSLYHGPRMVGFARVITDYATFAYVGDVFVLDAHRGQGLSKWLLKTVTEHPELQGLLRWVLLTRDAHGVYAPFGFQPLAAPERYMERRDPDVYQRARPGKR